VQFLVKIKNQGLFLSLTTLTEDEDRSTGYISVPPPCVGSPVMGQLETVETENGKRKWSNLDAHVYQSKTFD